MVLLSFYTVICYNSSKKSAVWNSLLRGFQKMGSQSNVCRILVVDGQGGGIGSQLVKQLRACLPEHCELIGVGTNVLATNAMLKAGASHGATGENAIVFNAARADVILGPIGVVMANGILGEVSPKMATAISGADAKKVLIPSSTCGIYVAGTEECRMEEYLRRAVQVVMQVIAE